MQEEDVVELLKRVMRVNHLTQEQLAEAAQVHQSTVSRLLGEPSAVRLGRGRAKLIAYAHHALAGELARGSDKVLRAFESMWDGSEEHASAIAKMIDAVSDLRPTKKVKRGSGRAERRSR